MSFLGNFAPGDTVFFGANFHDPTTGDIKDPTSPAAELRNPAGTWTSLAAPTKINSKDGHYGGTIDTSDLDYDDPGQYAIRISGTVATDVIQATELYFTLNRVNDVADQLITMIVSSSVAGYQFTEDALAETPGGAGGGMALTDAYEGSETIQTLFRLVRAVLLGKTTGNGTAFRDAADTKNRVVVTVDTENNRTDVMTDGT